MSSEDGRMSWKECKSSPFCEFEWYDGTVVVHRNLVFLGINRNSDEVHPRVINLHVSVIRKGHRGM